MADIEDRIQINNLEVEKARLVNEVTAEANKLTALTTEINQFYADVAAFEKTKREVYKEIAKENKDIEKKKSNLDDKEKEYSVLFAKKEKELKHIGEKIKDSGKALGKLNLQVLNAEDEFRELIKDIEKRTVDFNALPNLVQEIAELKGQITVLKNQKGQLNQEISTQLEDFDNKLKKGQEELEKIKTLAIHKELEAAEAQALTKRYTDELYTHMNDFQVVKGRLQTQWNKVFPELDMPLI